MAKFIKSLNPFECYIEAAKVLLPKKRYFNSANNAGKKNIVEVTDEQYTTILKDKVIKTMIDSGSLIVLDILPEEYKDVKVKNLELTDEVRQLKAQIEALKQKKAK
jgi:KaiC/GvpD/RAD55 family RecA-like ATPase